MSVANPLDELWREFARTRRAETREELIMAYRPLMQVVVGRSALLPAQFLTWNELEDYGTLGLGRAIDAFDAAADLSFEAFAPIHIRETVIDQICQRSWALHTVVARIRWIERALAELEDRLGQPASEEEIARHLRISVDTYRNVLLDASVLILALDAPLASLPADREVSSLRDLLEGRAMLEAAKPVKHDGSVALFSDAIGRLPLSERIVLSLFYHDRLAFPEICSIMLITEAHGSQLHTQAVLRLRAILNANVLSTAGSGVKHRR